MKKYFILGVLSLLFLSFIFDPIAPLYAASPKKANVESSETPEVKRSKPIETTPRAPRTESQPIAQPQTLESVQPQATALTPPPNLIQNSSFESANTSNPSLPSGWSKGRWGTNTPTFTYPVTGMNGGKAAKVDMTSYTSGDAKWYFANVSVTPGHIYQFSDFSLSNVSTEIDIEYTLTNGSKTYQYLATVNPSSSFQQTSVQFTVPANVVSLTIFHVIEHVGSLTVDEYSLIDQADTPAPTPTPPPTGNLIPNPDLETSGTNGNPLQWNKDRWSNNAGTFVYPSTGANGSKGVQVNTTSYTNGDAKWYFNPVSVTPGLSYAYSNHYISNRPTELTAQFQNTDGSFSYQWLGTVPASSTFTTAALNVTAPPNAKNVTIFHSLTGVGTLTIDNVSLTQKQAPGGIFATGAVTLSFDDGWLSQYQTAFTKLNSAGLKGTFYIATRQLVDYGFSGFVSKAQIKDMFNAGHEIGSHTRTHANLPTLSATNQQNEIQGSRQDLLEMNVGSVTTFAYPFGAYDAATLQIVKNAGYSAARATIDGNTVSISDPFQLPRQSVEVDTTFAQVKQWIDEAIASKQWLILTFHQIDTSGLQYSTTPNTFNQIVDYIVQKKALVVTVAQGIESLQ